MNCGWAGVLAHGQAFPNVFRTRGDPVQLWMGQLQVMQHDHALNGLVTGYLPLRKRRGRCHIRLRSAALCFFVAAALGFEVVAEAQGWRLGLCYWDKIRPPHWKSNDLKLYTCLCYAVG